MSLLHRPARANWRTLTSLEVIAGTLFAFVVIWALGTLGPVDMMASYRYEGASSQPTSIPFSVESQSTHLEVTMQFALRTLHASRFVVGPDDCIESMVVNGEIVEEASDLCNTYPGKAIHLPMLQKGSNTVALRIRDTGIWGGLEFRVSHRDPFWLAFSLLLLLTVSWLGMRVLKAAGYRGTTLAMPLLIGLSLCAHLSLGWHQGYGGDIYLNTEWTKSAVEFGVPRSYQQQVHPDVMLPNYPPLGIELFAMTGHVYKAFFSDNFDASNFHQFIKLPAMLADLLTIIVLFLLLIPLGGKRKAFWASSLYAFHPAVLHNSAVWGQTDAIFTLFLCVTLLCLQRSRWFLAGMAIMAGVLLKMQAIILLPVVAAAAALRWRRWMYGAAGSGIVLMITLLPFLYAEALHIVWRVYANTVGYYSSLSSNAFNFWVMLYSKDTGRSATDLFFSTVSYRTFGIALWLTVIIIVLIAGRRSLQTDVATRGKTGMLMLSAALIAYAFFLFNAEMHERYLFPYMALALPLVVMGKRGIALYTAASLLFVLNLTSVLPFGAWDHQLVQVKWAEWIPVAVGAAHLLIFVLTCWYIYLLCIRRTRNARTILSDKH